MKKQLIAVCAVAIAAVAQAATINWTMDTYICSETDTPVGQNVAVYFFDALNGSYTAETMSKLLSTDADWKTKFTGASNLGNATALAGSDNYVGLSGKIDHDGTSGTYGLGTTKTFLVVFDTDSAVDASMFYVVDYGTKSISNAQSTAGTMSFGDEQTIVGSIGGTGWTATAAVPEPTSGLLLLLGVAGLALKRKRA